MPKFTIYFAKVRGTATVDKGELARLNIGWFDHDPGALLHKLKTLCDKLVVHEDFCGLSHGTPTHWIVRDNPAYGHLGLCLCTNQERRLITMWLRTDEESRHILRAVVPHVGQHNAGHVPRQVPIIKDTEGPAILQQLAAAKTLLHHFRNIVRIAGVELPGSMEEKWAELFPDA